MAQMEKYVRSPPPLLEASKDRYLQEELKKLQQVLDVVYEQINAIKKFINMP